MNLDQNKIEDARLSFMSGHASFSAFCMTYTVVSLLSFMISNYRLNEISTKQKINQFVLRPTVLHPAQSESAVGLN